MKENYTHISFVLDRSGSMQSMLNDAIGGFNAFLAEQQAFPGEATFTLAQFDNIYELIYPFANLQDVKPLTKETFVPRGSTALLDAIGKCIIETGKHLAATPEPARPEKVLFVILTDGEENSSREFDLHKINELITHQQDVYQWQFIFLAANQDAIASASRLGIDMARGAVMGYTSQDGQAAPAFAKMSKIVSGYRQKSKDDEKK
jgi:uncharacterized protein YegL